MNVTLIATCLLIAFARVTDITLDTVRTVAIVQGRRGFAAILGFFEALVYIVAVAKVLQNFSHPAYAIAYAAGFAAGTYLGITVEKMLAFGEQIVSIFTRKGPAMVQILRAEGLRVTEVSGRGRDGELDLLFIQVHRRGAQDLARRARELDNECFYVIHDVRTASPARPAAASPGQAATQA